LKRSCSRREIRRVGIAGDVNIRRQLIIQSQHSRGPAELRARTTQVRGVQQQRTGRIEFRHIRVEKSRQHRLESSRCNRKIAGMSIAFQPYVARAIQRDARCSIIPAPAKVGGKYQPSTRCVELGDECVMPFGRALEDRLVSSRSDRRCLSCQWQCSCRRLHKPWLAVLCSRQGTWNKLTQNRWDLVW